jgi:hypothetical protein
MNYTMTTSFKFAVILAALITGATVAYAGSPDGLSIAVVGNASGAPYTGAIKQFVADHHAHKVADCSETRLSVANAYFTNLPPQLTGDLAVAAVHDKARRKRLGKLLTGFRDATLNHGFDAALAYEVRDGKVRLYGISGDPRDKVLASSLPLDEAQDQKKFNVAVCKAVAELFVLAEP